MASGRSFLCLWAIFCSIGNLVWVSSFLIRLSWFLDALQVPESQIYASLTTLQKDSNMVWHVLCWSRFGMSMCTVLDYVYVYIYIYIYIYPIYIHIHIYIYMRLRCFGFDPTLHFGGYLTWICIQGPWTTPSNWPKIRSTLRQGYGRSFQSHFVWSMMKGYERY